MALFEELKKANLLEEGKAQFSYLIFDEAVSFIIILCTSIK
jgi:hypothetical protein